MFHEILQASEDGAHEVGHQNHLRLPNKDEPALIQTYFPGVLDNVDRDVTCPCVAILPGGAYAFASVREAEPVALQMVAWGFAACVVTYSCALARYLAALVQAAGAVDYLRRYAAQFHIDPSRIFLMGFSAGGHLACDLGCEWQEPWLAKRVGAPSEDLRPTGLVLGYPVISLSEFVHKGSFQNLCGDDAQLMEWLSLEKCVTEDMPPTFVFHTLEDSSVPVENSLLLAEAMRKAGMSFTLRVFPYGEHGLLLATPEVGRRGKEGQVQPLMPCWLDLVAD
ncbi:MAG: alpha/beta hydrolase [Coriobacteriaceae bacterium]|nr:MAG: alpha/beta hydrolase [Coriobacteriaceae bacterium]